VHNVSEKSADTVCKIKIKYNSTHFNDIGTSTRTKFIILQYFAFSYLIKIQKPCAANSTIKNRGPMQCTQKYYSPHNAFA